MKIEYRILWLDDDIEQFIEDEIIDELKEFLRENNFSPDIITTDSQEDFLSILDDSFDLILTDYHMNKVDGHELNGDRIVEKIRANCIQTEILFYTARADLKDTDKISRVSFLETSSRTNPHAIEVLNETKNLVSLTIRKFQHIVAMRGMIMHETSTLDLDMINILSEFINNSANQDKVEEIGAVILEEAQRHFSRKLEDIEKLQKTSNLRKLSKDPFIFSASYKIQTMGQILEHFGLDDFSKDYSKEINHMRNIFAHAVLEIDEDTGRKYFKNGDMTFDEDLCKQIREDIIKNKENLKSLAERTKEQPPTQA